MFRQPATISVIALIFRVGPRLLENSIWDSSLVDYSASLLTARQTFASQTFCFSYWDSSKAMAKGRPHCHKTPRSHRQNRRCFRQVPVHRTSPPWLWWLTRKGPLCCSQLLCSSSRPYVSMSRRCKCMGEASIIISACGVDDVRWSTTLQVEAVGRVQGGEEMRRD